MDTAAKRLSALREVLREHGLTHYLVPSSDEHLNEYLPPWRQRRQWLSGFTGSAGDLLVGLNPAETWLFADSRYHLQAERELDGTGIGVQRVGAAGGEGLREVLGRLARERGRALVVGCDPMVLAAETAVALDQVLAQAGASLRFVSPNLVDRLWSDRPVPSATPLFRCPDDWTGRTAAEKVADLVAAAAEAGADAALVSRLDEVAWLTNLRAFGEVPYNPVFESFLYAGPDGVHLFLHEPDLRVPSGWLDGVPGLILHPYGGFLSFLWALEDVRVLVDPAGTTRGVLEALDAASGVTVLDRDSTVARAKAVKNPAELAAMERANLLASAAKTRALLWLRAEVAAARPVTEERFARRLEAAYQDLPGYRQLSFPTIAAAGDHAAIVHYAGADDTELRPGMLLLVDSGIHLAGGTTDDTRTVAVGAPTAEQRRVYTLVLKGHLAAARQRFPDGAPGAALDAVARAPLWNAGLQYGHGTGHGVGAFLNVHEGPFAITGAGARPHAARPLRAGMVTSVEPGYYRPGFGGIRLENLYRVAEAGAGPDGGRWLGLESLTWIPFDPALIDRELLEPAERAWLDAYQAGCAERLSPLLSAGERTALDAWLESADP